MSEKFCLIIDSGIGGLTTLYSIREVLPTLNCIYYADKAFMPYGSKSASMVEGRIISIIEKFSAYSLCAIVIACNTASAVSKTALRSHYDIPIICIEPAIALATTTNKKVMVLATPLTSRSSMFRELLAGYTSEFVVESLKDLATHIEKWLYDNSIADYGYALHILDSALKKNCDAIVLGCTHYVFLKDEIRKRTGKDVFDGNSGLARQLARTITTTTSCDPKLLFYSSVKEGEVEDLKLRQIYFAQKKRQ
ncbi:MAG: glutamate racemase [Clostridia bacterium]